MTEPFTADQIFSALTSALHDILFISDATPCFEIFPSAVPLPPNTPLLRDGPNIGLRAKDLRAAFTVARRIFFNQPQHHQSVSPTASSDAIPEAYDAEEAGNSRLHAAFVLLLFDPEHSTALNYVKQATLSPTAQQQQTQPQLQPADQPPPALLGPTLRLTAGLTASHLPKQPKSAALWHHRLWAVRTFGWRACAAELYRNDDDNDDDAEGQPGSGCATAAEFWEREVVRAVLAAAERHFANYHAFGYARRAGRLLLGVGGEKEEGEEGAREAIERVLAAVRAWCERHPADVSGWAYLRYVLVRLVADAEVARKVRGEVEALAGELGWKGEAVGWFLKNMPEIGVEGQDS